MKTFYSCYKRKLSSWSPTLGVSEKHQEMYLSQSKSYRNNVLMCINPFLEMYVKYNRAQIKSKAVVEQCGLVAVVLGSFWNHAIYFLLAKQSEAVSASVVDL